MPAKTKGKEKKHPGGRPPLVIDWEMVDRLCNIHCKGEEIAAALCMSYDSLARHCESEKGVGFADYIKEKSATGRSSLRRRQWEAAESGNVTMLIWLGKQHLDQTDAARFTGDANLTIGWADGKD